MSIEHGYWHDKGGGLKSHALGNPLNGTVAQTLPPALNSHLPEPAVGGVVVVPSVTKPVAAYGNRATPWSFVMDIPDAGEIVPCEALHVLVI